MTDADNQHDDMEPVSTERVAHRALILAALACRGSIDSGAGQTEAESVHARILDWVASLGLEVQLEPREQQMLRTPLGKLNPKDVVQATWSVEGLAVLAWALGLCNLPRHDDKVDPYAVAESVYFLNPDAIELIGSPRLLSMAELKAYRELVYAIHCRLRDFLRNRQIKDFSAWVEKAWLDLLKVDVAHLIVHGDLGIRDKEISEADEDCVRTCEWITYHRHRAILWLMGHHPTYSEVLVDT